MNEEKKYPKVPAFNNCPLTCKGHANYMLDNEFETKEDRDLLVRVIDNYLSPLTITSNEHQDTNAMGKR